MKLFLAQSTIFLLLIMAGIIFTFCQADGTTDDFYLKFTTPKQHSLIIGTSKAAQALQPDVFKKILSKELYNYAFSVDHSPYGRIYFESIKKKVKEETSDGLFILTVDPWSLSSFNNDSTDNNSHNLFREDNKCLNTAFVNIQPNVLYLTKFYSKAYYNLLLPKQNTATFLHNDGWLEVRISFDPITISEKIEEKVSAYKKERLPYSNLSPERIKYLSSTIEYLKGHGSVYLVKLPVHSKMLDLEMQLSKRFNNKIEELCTVYSLKYLNMENQASQYTYTDGNHLTSQSGKKVSREIATWVQRNPYDPK